jgi:hypothetical protein
MDEYYIECGADLEHATVPFTRGHYMKASEKENFINKYKNRGVYETMMQYIDPTWIVNAKGKTVIDVKEALKYGSFYLDFDYPLESERDFYKIKEDVSIAYRYLRLIMMIPDSGISFYFSGSKGIHLTVDAKTMGIEPHKELHRIYKSLAEDIAKYTKHQTIDVKIYDDKRMFRIENSYHIKGKAYKIPVSIKEIETCSLKQIREMAEKPRTIKKKNAYSSAASKLAIQKYVEKWNEKTKERKEVTIKKPLTELPVCIETMLEKTFRETIDERNNSAAALASFFEQQNKEKEETIEMMLTWNEEQCMPPLEPREIIATVDSVYGGSYRYGCETYKRLSGVCEKKTCPLFR